MTKTRVVSREKNCRCHTCDRDFHSMGIARHRAMHREKRERCTITYKSGETFEHQFDLRYKLNRRKK